MQRPKNLTLKFLVIGDSGVGKTSLLMRYCEDAFQAEYLSTIGVDFKMRRLEIEDTHVTLNIWDTAGQERFRNITKSFYKGAHGIVLVFSLLDSVSFQHITLWVDQIKESNNVDCHMVLVGMKADLQQKRQITTAMGEELAAKYNIAYFEASAKTNVNVTEIFLSLTNTIIKASPNQVIKPLQPLKKINRQKPKQKKECC